MLQTNKPRSVVDSEPAHHEEAGLGELVDFLFGFIRRQYPVVLVCLIVAAAVGFIYLRTTPPIYKAQATMVIDTRKGQFLQQQSLLAEAPNDSAQVESQLQIIKSENVAAAVIKELHLNTDPEFVGESGGLVAALFALFASSPPKLTEFDQMRQAIGVFDKNLDIMRVGMSYVIDISFSSQDPDRAAQIANAVADAYIVDQLDVKYQANRRASEWLQERLSMLRDQASAAERAVVVYKQENNIVSADGKLINDQQLGELNSQLVVARARTAEALARLNRIEAVIRADSPNAPVDATVSDALNSQIITKLRQQYLDLSNREAEWTARYGSKHLAVVSLRNQMREIRDSIFQEIRRYAETFKSDYEIAKQRQAGIEKELAQAVSQSETTNKAQITLRELQSSAQSARNLYDNFLQRYMESVQRESFPITEARLISRATRPMWKSRPKTLLVLALSIFGGIGLGVGIGFLREIMDRVFRTSSQVETALQAPCVALVPLLREPARIKTVANPSAASNMAIPRTIVRNQSVFWTVAEQPLSRFAEAVRSIKLAADLSGTNRAPKIIGITSSLPDEGKSTMAGALALLVAQVGGRVIVVDCDLRNPSLSRMLTPNASSGIVDVLSGECALDDAIWKDPSTNMAFLPSASKVRLFHTSEILASDPTKKLLDELRQSYDYVVVDLPPLAPVIDVRATTHLIDGYFLVVEWGRTKIDVVQHALNSANGVYENLLGIILNKADMDFLSRYENHRSKYYQNRNFGRYGYTD